MAMSTGVRIGALVAGVFSLIALTAAAFMAFENLDAKHIMVIQSPISGELRVFTEPGLKWQGFGTVTYYPRQAQYSFCSKVSYDKATGAQEETCPDATTSAKRLRFNDGGHALLNGSVNWEMPIDPKSVIEIHKKFGSEEAIEQRAVGKMLDAAIYLAGPLMSSTESSGSRRGELVNYINDQAENGVYVTASRSDLAKDAAGNETTTIVTEIVSDTNGHPKRQQGSLLGQFNIKLQPLSISDLKYDDVVESQIKQRQKATTDVQIAQANARKAEQDAITVEAQGKATAATAKWTQETINAKEIAEAQKKVTVAQLAAQEAEQFKKEQILRGEGEAERKKLVMNANGALEEKLNTYLQAQQVWADAFSKFGGQMVPGVVMGGGGAGQSAMGNAQTFVDMMTMKAAKDLSLDMSVSGNTSARKK